MWVDTDASWHHAKMLTAKKILCRRRPQAGLRLRNPPMFRFQHLRMALPVHFYHLCRTVPLLPGGSSGDGIFEWALATQWTIEFHLMCSTICRGTFACLHACACVRSCACAHTHRHTLTHTRWLNSVHLLVRRNPLKCRQVCFQWPLHSVSCLPTWPMILSGTLTLPRSLGLSCAPLNFQIKTLSQYWKVMAPKYSDSSCELRNFLSLSLTSHQCPAHLMCRLSFSITSLLSWLMTSASMWWPIWHFGFSVH